ncbi:hemocyanin A chain [Cephus cinctus]|uniref:Hemocyanin A chain n=1 Tax=Cephus cinctus TaxID=211228 RepID=A0AAJ7FRZ6_CEPCN|nr:hemocyanin A chain [Cephus cinctus]
MRTALILQGIVPSRDALYKLGTGLEKVRSRGQLPRRVLPVWKKSAIRTNFITKEDWEDIMRVCTVVTLMGIALAVTAIPADKDFLSKQKEVLHLLSKVHEPNRFKHQSELGKSIESGLDGLYFKDITPLRTLLKMYKAGKLLPRGAIFTLFDEDHRKEMITLFESLYFAGDWTSFLKTACWARDHINEGVFIYALSVAVLHRQDCRGIILPPAYETYPHLFVNSQVIHEAYQAKMRQQAAVIRMNFTGTIKNPEQRVAYLGEDLGMNSHHAHWHMDFPFWWRSADYGLEKDRKGELFYYMHHQLIARFDLERLSNELPFVEPLSFEDVIVDGFHPQTTYRVGGEFPSRPDNFAFHDLENIKVHDMQDYVRRIKQAIAHSYVLGNDGSILSINTTNGINLLGAIMEPSYDSPHPEFYGALHNYGHIMLGQITDPKGKFNLPPGVMEHFETATRDPAFFRLHKYIDNIFKEHKDSLSPYTQEELSFSGVQITDVEVSSLNTFFEDFDVDLLNALDDTVDLEDVAIHARVRRLNHAPFTINLKFKSDKAGTAAVRIFLGPKYDWFGQELDIEEKRSYMVELDKFTARITPGENNIMRKSTESSVTIPDPVSTKTLWERVEAALQGIKSFEVDKDHRHCGYPDRLLLPKGKPEGMPFTLYVILTDFENEKVNNVDVSYNYGGSISYCGAIHGHKYPDSRPMGFPFDRKIEDLDNFLIPNMITKDVTITFKG